MAETHAQLARYLAYVTRRILEQSRLVTGAFLVLSAFAAGYAISNLGVNTATNEMFSPELEWFQSFNDFRDEFPILDRNVIVVIEGQSAEQTDRAQIELSRRLLEQPGLFGEVLAIEATDFFQRNGLLFLEEESLFQLGDRLAAMQAVVGRLSQTPHLAGLTTLIQDYLENPSSAPEEFQSAISEITAVFRSGADSTPQSISWQNLFATQPEEQAEGSVFRRVIIVVPPLDFEGAEPRRRVLNGIRDEARALNMDGNTSLSIRLTGGLALEQEELASVADGIIRGAIATVILVVGILLLTFRSTKLLLASFIALISGLFLTAAFTALTIGYINLISVAFVVLYIGLGIDFAIHYCLRYRELLAKSEDHKQALIDASEYTGSALVLCAITSSIGFLAFVPTAFSGVAQLGLIAGFGMFASLLATLILLPALINIFGPPKIAMAQHSPPLFRLIGTMVSTNLYKVRIAIVTLAVLAGYFSTWAEFDSNPLNLRDPYSESVIAYRDLLADSDSPPLTLNALIEEESLESITAQLERLPQVGNVRSARDLVPQNQSDKLAILDDFILFIGTPQTIQLQEPLEQRDLQALRNLIPLLMNSRNEAEVELGLAISEWVGAIDNESTESRQAAVTTISKAILDNLVFTWNRLVRGFEAQQFGLSDLPEDLQDLWIARDGRLRIEILPRSSLGDMAQIGDFVIAVRDVMPDATGQPVMQFNAGRTVVAAFVQAMATAIVVVFVLLLILLRDTRQTLAVILPLLIATTATVAIAALIGQPFNFANVITLPLLIGVGVDNGIHMMHRHNQTSQREASVMVSSTARAILFSTITTIGSFGTLAFSNHPGTASMGVILAIGMTTSLLAALFVVPAILEKFTKA